MKRWIFPLGMTIATAAFTAACAPTPETYEGDVEVPEQAEEAGMEMSPEEVMADLAERWDNGMNAADPEALLALYVDEGAAAMPPDQPMVTGKEELRGFFEDFFAAGQVTVDDIVESVVADGDHMVGKGSYTLSITNAEGETSEESGHWLSVVARQEDSSYKVVRNIWNRDAPAPGAPQPPPIAESGPAAAPDAACQSSPRGLDESFEADLEAGNVATLVAVHTEDGSRMPPGMPEMKGRDKIGAYLASRIDPFSERVLDLTDITEMTDGTLGITHGRYRLDYTPAQGGEHVTGEGKYLNTSLKGDDGCWRLHWALWNPDAPGGG